MDNRVKTCAQALLDMFKKLPAVLENKIFDYSRDMYLADRFNQFKWHIRASRLISAYQITFRPREIIFKCQQPIYSFQFLLEDIALYAYKSKIKARHIDYEFENNLPDGYSVLTVRVVEQSSKELQVEAAYNEARDRMLDICLKYRCFDIEYEHMCLKCKEANDRTGTKDDFNVGRIKPYEMMFINPEPFILEL